MNVQKSISFVIFFFPFYYKTKNRLIHTFAKSENINCDLKPLHYVIFSHNLFNFSRLIFFCGCGVIVSQPCNRLPVLLSSSLSNINFICNFHLFVSHVQNSHYTDTNLQLLDIKTTMIKKTHTQNENFCFQRKIAKYEIINAFQFHSVSSR